MLFVALAGLLFALPLASCRRQPANEPAATTGQVELKSYADRVSYMLGTDIGNSLRGSDAGINPALVSRGLEDSYQGKPLLLSAEEIAKLKSEFAAKLQQDYQAKLKILGEKNRAEGEAFLAANRKKAGVITTASGLQYQVLTQGKGPRPGPNARVKVNYRGLLVDGKEFDSSYRRGTPAELQVASLIPGWSEALQLMPVGSKYRFVLPPSLAYGDKEVDPKVGPNSTLIFEIELLGIE